MLLASVELQAWQLEAEGKRLSLGENEACHVALQAESGASYAEVDFNIVGDFPALAALRPEAQRVNAKARLRLHGDDIVLDDVELAADVGRVCAAQLSLVPLFKELPLELQAPGLRAGITVQRRDAHWRVQASPQLSAEFLQALKFRLPVNVQGNVQGDVQMEGEGAAWQAQGQFRSRDLAFSSVDGMQAGQNLHMDMNWRMSSAQDLQLELALRGGELLVNPLFWQLAPDKPLRAAVHAKRQGDLWHLDDVRLQDSSLCLKGEAVWNGGWQSASIHQGGGSMALLFERYLAPFLQRSVLAGAKASGELIVHADWRRNTGLHSLGALLQHVNLQAEESGFAVQDLDGQFGFDARQQSSSLRWREAQLRHVPIGAAQIDFLWQGRAIYLLKALRIPVLDGAVVIDAINSQPAAGGGMRYVASVHIEPFDLAHLAGYFKLPAFQSVVSGELENVVLEDHSLSLGSPVRIQAFDGETVIENFVWHDLFADIPRLSADVRFQNLSLEPLTEAFGFGMISGRVDGAVEDLEVINWKPLQFKAWLHSVNDHNTPQRISHEAVRHLAAAGGGASEMAARVVSFYNRFPYKRLGFKAKLQGKTLYLDGVAPHGDGGFYLLEGSALPHINIIAYESVVDWEELLRRLKRALKSDAPTIQ